MSHPNPASYQDPEYWEKLAHAAQYKLGLAQARVKALEAENKELAWSRDGLLKGRDVAAARIRELMEAKPAKTAQLEECFSGEYAENDRLRARVAALEALCTEAAEDIHRLDENGYLEKTRERLEAAGLGEAIE